jgi:cytochrome c biogenesis protein
MLWAYRGDLGEDAGIPGSVYRIDPRQVDAGRLGPVGEPRLLRPGETWTLDDGTTVEFVGTRQWITLSVRHDPGQIVALVGVVAALAGLMLSLAGKRRRVFFRVSRGAGAPTPLSSLVAAGGLPRTDYPGFAEEFARVVADALGPAGAAAEPLAHAGRN